MAENIKYVKSDEWENEVLKGGIVAVDFYSTECPPCESLAAKFEPLSQLYGEHVKFVKIFRQENRELALSLGVKSSPTLLFYKNGEQTGDFLTGAIKRKDIVRNLDKMIGDVKANHVKSRLVRSESNWDIAIIGGGPAGLSAAIYAAQAKARTILVDKGLPGGQVSITHQVSNYPGFVDPLPGYMLAHYMSEQAKKAGVEFRTAVDVTSIDLTKMKIVVDNIETISANKIILATGASPRPIGIPGEMELRGKGISYCGTCDAKYYEGKEVVVIGGGDSALEESLFIARFASRVTIYMRADKPRAKKEIQELVEKTPNIRIVARHRPISFSKGTNNKLIVMFEDAEKKVSTKVEVDGVFVFIGMEPNTAGFDNLLEKDEWGYVRVNKEMQTSIQNVYAVGDLAEKSIRQITVAVAEGTIAAINAAKNLS